MHPTVQKITIKIVEFWAILMEPNSKALKDHVRGWVFKFYFAHAHTVNNINNLIYLFYQIYIYTYIVKKSFSNFSWEIIFNTRK